MSWVIVLSGEKGIKKEHSFATGYGPTPRCIALVLDCPQVLDKRRSREIGSLARLELKKSVGIGQDRGDRELNSRSSDKE